MDSILDSTKKNLGVGAEYDVFDPDLIMHINSAFFMLYQIGVGPAGFRITGSEDKWSDFLGTRTDQEAVKSYIYTRVRLLFDPPQTAHLIKAFEEQMRELEWRLNLQAEGAP